MAQGMRGDLSPKQRKVLEAYAKGAMIGRGTLADAARAGGYKGGTAGLAVTASKILKKAQSKAYLADLKARAVARVDLIETAKSPAKTVDLVAEALAVKRRIMNDVNGAHLGDVLKEDGTVDLEKLKATPPGIVRKLVVKSTTDAEGQAYASHEVTLEPLTTANAAADGILRHMDAQADRDAGVKGGAHVQALILQLVNGPGATVDARKLLRSVLGTGGE
jgi:hypothetical protein